MRPPRAFNSLHNLSHPGVRATQRLITARYLWPGMNTDVRQWTRIYPQCQTVKVHRHTRSPLSRFLPPDARFDHVHIDLVGPLPTSQNCTYLLTCVDRFTRWPEAFPIPDSTAATVAQAFVSGWIARFGMPSTITTDKGAQFESALFQHLLSLLGSCRTRTTSYHPQSNGLVERFHRHLKACLRASSQPASWVSNLPIALLGIRAAFREDLGCSSAQLVYGTTIRLHTCQPYRIFRENPGKLTSIPVYRGIYKIYRIFKKSNVPPQAAIVHVRSTLNHVLTRYYHE